MSDITGSGVIGTVQPNGGALMETGSNADGHYVRFADGTQICTHTVSLTKASNSRLEVDWAYPKSFKPGEGVAVAMSFGAAYSVTPPTSDLGWMGGRVTGAATVENGVTLRLYRINGGTDFGAADTIEAHVVATGRWD